MFGAGSLSQAINIYVVENIAQTLVALGLVAALIKLLRIADPALRIRLLLLPIAVPLLAAPFYYAVFPNRQELPVLTLDKLIDLDEKISTLAGLPSLYVVIESLFFALAALFLTKGALTVAASLYLRRRYARLAPGACPRIDRLLESILQRTGGGKRPSVLFTPCEEVRCCVFGLGRAYILVSKGLLDALPDEHLEAVLAHEVAHVRRHDSRLAGILVVLRHVLFFNPLVPLLARRIACESEKATDRLAVQMSGKPVAYAESLVGMWRVLPPARDHGHGEARTFISRGPHLRERVLYVLEGSRQPTPRLHRWMPHMAGAALFTGLFFVC
ncbi:MAG: M56 family metallopeptidase [Chloroflexi bacterium]|nr:M56 family metallopeptidase [Chloroflexota bacterium]